MKCERKHKLHNYNDMQDDLDLDYIWASMDVASDGGELLILLLYFQFVLDIAHYV